MIELCFWRVTSHARVLQSELFVEEVDEFAATETESRCDVDFEGLHAFVRHNIQSLNKDERTRIFKIT